MFEDNTSTVEVLKLIAEDEKLTLQNEAVEVPERLRITLIPTWIFTGQYAMPCSEHLIPFRI